MGQCECGPCVKPDALGELESELNTAGVQYVSLVQLPAGVEECYVKALEAMVQAIEHQNLGAHTKAFTALAYAEMWLGKGPGVPLDLQGAYDSDPELQTVKKMRHSMDIVLKGSEPASPEEVQESKNRMLQMARNNEQAEASDALKEDAKEQVVGRSRRNSIGGTDALARVRQLCCEARIFEAAAALNALQLDIASVYKLELSEFMDNACQHGSRLQSDSMIAKLQSVHGRYKKHLDPQGLLALALQGSAEKWVSGETWDPSIHPKFHCSIRLRLAEDTEREENGPMSQFIAKVTFECWPQTLTDFVAMERETDLFKKEFIDSCRFITGMPGELEQLMSSSLHVVIRPPLLPLSFENAVTREFAVCEKSPLSGYSPGVLEIEQNLPLDKKEFEGWKVPPQRLGYVRQSGLTIKHIAPSAEDPHCVTVTMVGRGGAPLPRWMLPLGLVKNILLDLLANSFKKIKEKLLGDWESYGYPERIAKNPDLYGAIAAMKPDTQ